MLVVAETDVPPNNSSWCGDFDFTEDEITEILEAFYRSKLGDPDLTITYFKCKSERWSVYVNHAGAPPLITGFIYGWETHQLLGE